MDWRHVRITPGEVIRFNGSPVTIVEGKVNEEDGSVELTVDGDIPVIILGQLQGLSMVSR